ncbi:methylase of polypeptide subunit release factors [Sphingomonas vulcanisoli]|uniref:Methylase of polypeptide subunit release factors n=1 Tax=Sphingomonas vulcanisoli TaxID=1658060 RepID=A0ABX0TSG5_9SPHN|nr:class I SAM-dependent methyltransferase [Sphingomonas vulcanisoli]NIJ08468.1 methylase of polypeptide subunit release factors [Sphingomonas vulcanisoli]
MAHPSDHEKSRSSLLRVLGLLKQQDYKFVTPTPATHARVIARPDRQEAHSLEDVLGWSLSFRPGVLPPDVEACLADAGMLSTGTAGQRSLIRVSWLEGNLYLHSAYPTDDPDSVFFGPDSYRFAALIERELRLEPSQPNARIVDIGTGSGVGAITAALLCPSADVVMTDINSAALGFARLNAQAAGVEIQAVETRGLDGIEGLFDIALINPPFIIDEGERSYRDGGKMHGAELSLDLAKTALDRLRPGGRVILYTGSAIIQGRDALRSALAEVARKAGGDMSYREVDPDVFGEELAKPQYCDVDRIALVNCIIRKTE